MGDLYGRNMDFVLEVCLKYLKGKDRVQNAVIQILRISQLF
ncbi:hypothetical protein SAMN06265379_102328 [Saccharicrinis carchari]|uniref:Uncharacterized protein n=1 Tax=Saccharicrinis carchari TaxID=1168039 RepID=A0A521C1V6_SACCC|nr:hypothetical protein SAMN06265379_102328 [Saccharicrinis carchari]